MMKVKIAANILTMQLAWIACAYGASAGVPSIGVAACLLAIGVNLVLTDDRVTFVRLTLLLGLFGFAAESILAGSSIVEYGAPGPYNEFAPLWIVTLWMAFAGMIYPTFGFLTNRPIFAALLGASMAPWSYFAATKLGALEFSEPIFIPWASLAALWAIALPIAIQVRMMLSHNRAMA